MGLHGASVRASVSKTKTCVVVVAYKTHAHVQYVTMYAGYTCDRSYTTHMRLASGQSYAVCGPAHTEWHPAGGFTSRRVSSLTTSLKSCGVPHSTLARINW